MLPTFNLITNSLSSTFPHLEGFNNHTRGFNTPECKHIQSHLQQQGSLMALPAMKLRQGLCRYITSLSVALLPCHRVFHGCKAVESSRAFQAPGCKRQKLAGKWNCLSLGWVDTLQQHGDGAKRALFICASIRMLQS